MVVPIPEACPRCGTESAEAVVSPSGEKVCLGCLFSLTRRSAAEIETSRLAEMETVVAGPDAGSPGERPSFPNYEILGVLGKGGMGVVYKARQKGLDRIVALKVLRPGVDDDEEGIKRFLNEARSAARLQHPHIVSIHEVSSGEGRLFFSMEYVEGRLLGEWLLEQGRTFPEIADLLRKVALAVHAAHEMGVVHRDLKPGNIMVDRGGEPKVTDFGIAKDITADSRITKSGMVVGTPAYMAPEQAVGDGAQIGPRADVYALGAVLYECLAKRPPFRASTLTATLRQVLAGEPVPPREIDPSVPRDLEAICRRAMEKLPERRYPSALAFAEDLARCREGLPVLARPRRLGRIVAAFVAVLAIVAALLVRPGGSAREGSAAEQLGRLIRESRGEERKGAAASLLELGPKGIPTWRGLIKDPEAEVRWRAAEALGELKAREALPELILALKDPDRDVGKRAAEALVLLEAVDAAPLILEVLKEPNAGVRQRASRLLVRLQARQVVPGLVELLADDEPRVRESAAGTLGMLGAGEAAGDLDRLLEDENTGVRQAAIGALVDLEARDRIPAIVRLLRSEDAAIRESAASALGKLGAREAIPELTRLRGEERSPGVLDAVDRALKLLSAPPK